MKRTVSKILETLQEVIDNKAKLNLKNVKPVAEKIMNSTLYKSVSFLSMGYILIACTWNILFHDDFLTRRVLWIILFTTIIWIVISKLLNVMFEEGEKSEVVVWIVIFLMHFIGFLFS